MDAEVLGTALGIRLENLHLELAGLTIMIIKFISGTS